MSDVPPDFKIVDGGVDPDTGEPLEVAAEAPKKKAKAKAPKLNDLGPPPLKNGKFVPPHASAVGAGERTMCTRRFLPKGFIDDDNVYLGGPVWYESIDLEEVLDRLQTQAGGGKWRLEFFKDGISTGVRDVEVMGEPLPLREPTRYGGPPPMGPHGPGYPPPHQAPQYPAPYPPGPIFVPPPTSREESLREELQRERREREAERRRIEEREREAKIEAKFSKIEELVAKALEVKTPIGPDPYLAEMRRRDDADRERRERDERERVARDERERREKVERDEKERLVREKAEERERAERQRQEEREEKRREDERTRAAEREEREERRRTDERKERLEREERDRLREDERRKEQQAREDRLAKEHKELMQTITSKVDKDPLDQLIKLKKVESMLSGKDDEPEGLAAQVVGAVASVAEATSDLIRSRTAEKEPDERVNVGDVGVQPQQIAARDGDSEEARLGRFVVLLKFVTDAYKEKNEPAAAATALVGYARGLEDQGHAGALADLGQLAKWYETPAEQIVAGMALVQAQVTNQAQVAHIDDFRKLVASADGLRWVRAVMVQLGGAE